MEQLPSLGRRQSMRIVNVSSPKRASQAASRDRGTNRRTIRVRNSNMVHDSSPSTAGVITESPTENTSSRVEEHKHSPSAMVFHDKIVCEDFADMQERCQNTESKLSPMTTMTDAPAILLPAAVQIDHSKVAETAFTNSSSCPAVHVSVSSSTAGGSDAFRRIDHRNQQPAHRTTASSQFTLSRGSIHNPTIETDCPHSIVASEFAFEIGSYATHLTVDAVNAQTGRAAEFQRWMFPTEFQPLNALKCVRRRILQHQHALTTYFIPITVVNVLIFYSAMMVSTQYLSMAFSVGWIFHGCATVVMFVVPLGFISTSVMDRHILYYLCTSKFEVWLFIYQMTFVLGMQCLMSITFLQVCALIVWYTCNLQMVFLDAAIWYNYRVKRAIIMMSIALTVLLVVMDSQSREFGDKSTACFITCSSLHASSIFTMCLVMMYGCRCLINLLRFPTACIILKLPLLYQSASTRKETRARVIPTQSV